MRAIISHILIDTDDTGNLEATVDKIKLQYAGRGSQLKVVYVYRGIHDIHPMCVRHEHPRTVRGYHSVRPSLFSALRQCIFVVNREDANLALRAMRSSGPWIEMLTRRQYSRYVRKHIPPVCDSGMIPESRALRTRFEAFYTLCTQSDEQLAHNGEGFLGETCS